MDQVLDMKEGEIKQEMQMQQEAPIEACDACKSGQHGCEQYFCMCDCRYPLPWRGGATVTHNTILDANGETVAYDVISATRPSVIRERILRAVNNHDALVEALKDAIAFVERDDTYSTDPEVKEMSDKLYAVLSAAQEQS